MSIDDKYKIDRQGKTFVLYAGLLNEAHKLGLKRVETQLLQVPDTEHGIDTAIVHARVETEDGRIFCGLGDASPKNVSKNIVPHIIRMAETRAKARAFRDAVNIDAAVEGDPTDEDIPNLSAPNLSAMQGGASYATVVKKARKSQIDLLRELATDARGEEGPERLEKRIGKPLDELTVGEAEDWIAKINPEGVKVK